MTYEDARDKFRISIPAGARSARPCNELVYGSAWKSKQTGLTGHVWTVLQCRVGRRAGRCCREQGLHWSQRLPARPCMVGTYLPIHTGLLLGALQQQLTSCISWRPMPAWKPLPLCKITVLKATAEWI